MVLISRLRPEVIKMCRPLIMEDDVLVSMVKKFSESLQRSLTAEEAGQSKLKCKQTYISDFPDGSEKGSAFGLHISGKVFRLVHANFRGGRAHSVSSRLYEIPEAKLTGSGFRVVEYVARCVANFVETSDATDQKIILGISIGFPMEQESLQEARIQQWTEDFKCDDFINEDFFTQLKMALKSFKSTKNMYVIAATGDSESSLLCGLYRDAATRIGVTIGKRIDVCYLEKQENITVFSGDGMLPRAVIVNIGLESFGDDGCLDAMKTEIDKELDAGSKEPGNNTLEKLIFGEEMGELLRLYLVKLVNEKVILDGVLKPKLKKPETIRSNDVFALEDEEDKEFVKCRAVFKRLGYAEVSDSDCRQVSFVARCLTKRSTNLLAAFVAAILSRLEMKEIRVCADGPLLRRHPAYGLYLYKKIEKLKKPDMKCVLAINDKEDMAVGAGLLALKYKDNAIKVEDKHRMLPPMRNFPPEISCRDCDSSTGSAGGIIIQNSSTSAADA